MIIRLFCKVRAVLSITSVVLLAGIYTTGYAQSSGNPSAATKITLSCDHLRLEDALQRMALKAGVFFIYSTSVLELNNPVSFSVHQRPLSEVLESIGRPMNLTFRYEGKYVIIKKNTAPQPVTNVKPALKEIRKPLTVTGTVVADASSQPSLTAKSTTERRLYTYSFLPTPPPVALVQHKKLTLDSISLLTIIQPRDFIRKKWFASAGLFMNDFTFGGVELRGGHNHLFAVVNAGIVNSGHYRTGYGAGTSVSLSKKWSLNLVYTYARLSTSQDYTMSRGRNHFIIEKGYKVTIKHNQAKLMAQYNLSPRFSVHLGTTYNIVNTDHELRNFFVRAAGPVNLKFIDYETRPALNVQGFSQSIQPSTGIIVTDPAIPAETAPRKHYQTTKTWVGWEAGVSYRINF